MALPRETLGLVGLVVLVTSCTVTVNQPNVTGIELTEPRPPVPTLPPGLRIVDPALGEDFEVPRATVVRLPGEGDLPPQDGADPSVSGSVDQASLAATLDYELRGPGRLAQRFRAGRAGRLTAVAVRLRAAEPRAVTGTLALLTMNPDGTPGDEELARSATVPLLEAGQPGGWVRATFDPAPEVGRSRPYVWVLQPSGGMTVRVVAGSEASYPDGTGWIAATGPWSAAKVDFAFQTWMAP
ncbi:MAG: hypothetical protein VKQ33_12440 [Candidatus Sericytochromatia bacterium]|nr:hypothetical protein [Candidatus Sericytochromatia bacterium]